LKPFGDAYDMIMKVEGDEKIIMKQLFFMMHEKELKAQAKIEKQ
jgi:hypothetical protein